MREIKFRAWDKDKNKMLYQENHTFIFRKESISIYPSNEYDDYSGPEFIDEFIIMQYTNLKDKNDKEIYEGDIVEINKDKTYIEFQEGAYWFCYNNKDRFTADWIRQQNGKLEIETETFEVIGNIYENPELLKL